MGNLIVPELIKDFTVYGVPQVQYTVGDDSNQDYTSAVTCASFKEAAAIEAVCTGYSEVVKARQRKVDELGEVLAYLSAANAKFDSDPKTSDKVKVDNASWVREVCKNYDVDITWDGDQITYGNMQKATTNVQYAIDREDNDLEQDMVSLQSYISKRDNAFTNASKVVKKTLNAGSTTIADMGS